MEERHLSLSEVAELMEVTERTVRRWIKSGKLKAYKPGRDYRIPESAVKEFVEGSEAYPKHQAPPQRELEEQSGAHEEQNLPTAEEMDDVSEALERIVVQRNKTIDRWREVGIDAYGEARWGYVDMDAANDQFHRVLQRLGADRVLERWERTPELVAELDIEAVRRQTNVFYELLNTAVTARDVARELAAEQSSEWDLRGLTQIEAHRKNQGEPPTRNG